MKKIDLLDLLWKPRLALTSLFSVLRGLFFMIKEDRKYLPMKEFEPDQGYPRPQMVRDSFLSLDGEWELSLSQSEDDPGRFDHRIVVPFPPQTHRSGVKEKVGDAFWYRKRFSLDPAFVKDRVLLHFEAADQVAEVYLNRHRLGRHEGGYLPFSFDITDHLKKGENELLVYIKDELSVLYPYGKQSKSPGQMWYPQISGLWKSVWMESVPKEYIRKVSCIYRERKGGVFIRVAGNSPSYGIRIFAPVMGEEAPGEETVHESSFEGRDVFVPLQDIRLWSPDTPWLYYFELTAGEDRVRAYFALRTIGIEKHGGRPRICLNHRPFYFHAVLDQGYYSDGIMTPVSYRYYEKDIRLMKELGFNALRKHLKVENARFYYDCDRLGMAVMQDMVNSGSYSYFRDTIMPTFWPLYIGHFKKDVSLHPDILQRKLFIRHSREMMEYLYCFPSVLYYTIFNEGWGQFDSDRVLSILKKKDPTRVYDSTSGWYRQKGGDIDSIHCYFHRVPVERWKKPAVISEFGGFSFALGEHSCFSSKTYGYGGFRDKNKLSDRIVRLYDEEIIPHLKDGICGSVYTQLSDVEEECNGMYSYDRAVCKVDKEKMRRMAGRLMGAYAQIERQE